MKPDYCKGCGSRIRRTYSLASVNDDDCMESCDCPTDLLDVVAPLLGLLLLAGLFSLGAWLS